MEGHGFFNAMAWRGKAITKSLFFRRRRGDGSQISMDFEGPVRDSSRRLLLFQQAAINTRLSTLTPVFEFVSLGA